MEHRCANSLKYWSDEDKKMRTIEEFISELVEKDIAVHEGPTSRITNIRAKVEQEALLVDEIEQLVDAGRLRVWEKKFENNWYTFLKLIDSSDKLTEEEESKRYWAEYYDDYDREHPKSLSEQGIDNMSAFDYEGDPEDFEQWLESEGY